MARINWKKIGAGIAGFSIGSVIIVGGLYLFNRGLDSEDSGKTGPYCENVGLKCETLDELFVDIDKYKIKKEGRLLSGGLTSCSLVCFYDKKERIGAMAHFPLAFPPEEMEREIKIKQILEEMVSMGGKRENIKAASLRCAKGANNSTEYLLEALRKEGVENKDLCTYSNEILGTEFNVPAGVWGIYRSARMPPEIHRF